MNCLEIVQQACYSIGIDAPSTLENASKKDVLKMISLLNRLGNSLVEIHDWRELIKEKDFTSTGADSYTIQTAMGISDYNNIITANIYDRTNNQIIVPHSAERYQIEKMYLGSTPFYKFRFMGDSIYFTPAVPSGNVIYFNYKINTWLSYDDGVNPVEYKTQITKNIDTPLLSDELLTKGLIWKLKEAEGLSYDEDFRSYEKYLDSLRDTDKDLGVIDFNRIRYMDISNLPNTSY